MGKGSGGEGNGLGELFCLFCQDFRLYNTRNFTSVTHRVFRVCVISSIFAHRVTKMPSRHQNAFASGAQRRENAKSFASAQL